MSDLLPFLITGAVTGSLYGLAALGLVLTFRTSGVFNFGQGAIAAGAAFAFYTLHVEHHMAWPLAALVTMLAFGVIIGWVMERLTRGLADVHEAIVVVATVGLLLGIEGFLYIQYGSTTRSFPQFLPSSGFTVEGVNISWAQVISVAIATASAAVLYWFLKTSTLGVAMRAVVDNPTLVALSGENPARVRQYAWAIGSAFAAMSGILLAPTLGLDANLLTLLVVQAFGAAAIGRFSSLPLTYLGGLIVGVAAAVATKYFKDQPFNGIPPAVPFLVLVAVLLIVPVAKLPRRRPSLASLVADVPPLSRRAGSVLAIAGVIALLAVPSVVDTNLPLWTAALIASIVFGSLALLVWTSGQISLCHAAFVAVGATSMGHLTSGANGVPWGVGVLLAGLITVPVGALVAVPAIRLSGLYLALATLGFGILMQNVMFPTDLMFGSALTVTARRPHLGALDGANDRHLYFLVLGIAITALAMIAVLARSRLGRLLRALAETPTMCATHGLGVNMTRLIVFCVSAFFAGIAGALVVTQYGAASGVGYGPIQSLMYIAVLAICGTRLLRSSILAAGLLAILPGYLTGFDIDRQTFGFGSIAVIASILLAKRPQVTEFVNRAAAASSGRVLGAPLRRPGRALRPPASDRSRSSKTAEAT